MDILINLQVPNLQMIKKLQDSEPATTREGRPPPIKIFEQQVKDTIQGTKTNDFQIERMNDYLHVVKMNDYNDYKKTIEILKDTNTQHFSHFPKSDEIQQFLLRGRDNSYEPKEIMEIINNLEIPNLTIENITRFETAKSIELQKKKLPIYMIQLNPDSNEGALKSKKH
ncbi:hypothetical protein PV325_008759 [Microctonus aethiopoides]|nr:hypothetical protein PV325_008759 [Microctonus aethiopoides]